jgi:hypothetical protein
MNPLEVLQLVTEKLERLDLPYMVAGSFASTIYGEPRYTQDADIVVQLTCLSIDGVTKAFSSDFYIDRGQVERAIQSCSSFNIIHLDSAFKVDLFTVGRGGFEEQALNRRGRKTLDSESQYAPFVQTPEDTVLAKLLWFQQGGRVSDQQWRDVLGILKVQEGMLDITFLQKWAGELRVADLLEEAFRDAGASSAR